DMRDLRKLVSGKIDVVSSIFSLHHLPTREELLACFNELAAAASEHHSSVWIFDHARPKRLRTAWEVPELFTATASVAFRTDSRNSLCASWSFQELVSALSTTTLIDLNCAASMLLPIYQIHWSSSKIRDNRCRW